MALYALLDVTVTPNTITGFCSPPTGSTIAQCEHLTEDQIANAKEVPVGTYVNIGDFYENETFVPKTPAPTPSPAQVAALAYNTAVQDGLTVKSDSTSGLDGVYAFDKTARDAIAAEAQFVVTYNEFTNETNVNRKWYLQDGTTEVYFPTIAVFLSFAKKAGQLGAALDMALANASAMPALVAQIL
jgi:hypothetical protein